ncbi:MAG: V-type ATPase subunit [Methanomicrobiaceae archaeon]|nr:V-type ATPase subunit [Methanomicrobiaceae archaeon]
MSEISMFLEEVSSAIMLTPADMFIVLLLLILFLILFLLTLMGYFNLLLSIASFSFPNARVMALGNPCTDPATVADLLQSHSVHELAEKLRQFGYAVETVDLEDPSHVERYLESVYRDELEHLEMAAPEGLKPFLQAYGRRFEAAQLKVLIRAVHAGVPPDQIAEAVTPAGGLSPPLLRKAADARDLDELVGMLAETGYGRPLLEALPDHHGRGDTLVLETAVDRVVMEDLDGSIMRTDTLISAPPAALLAVYADAANTRILLRAARDRIDREQVIRSLIPYGKDLSWPLLLKLAELEGPTQILARIEETALHSAIENSIAEFEQTGSFVPVEYALDQFLFETARTLETIYHHGPGPILKFLVGREYELRNIRTIYWGVREQAPLPAIRQHLILAGGTA